jgi:hypothetical protein
MHPFVVSETMKHSPREITNSSTYWLAWLAMQSDFAFFGFLFGEQRHITDFRSFDLLILCGRLERAILSVVERLLHESASPARRVQSSIG